eukprot:2885914-Pyramimonas_sp.AAC.1
MANSSFARGVAHSRRTRGPLPGRPQEGVRNERFPSCGKKTGRVPRAHRSIAACLSEVIKGGHSRCLLQTTSYFSSRRPRPLLMFGLLDEK